MLRILSASVALCLVAAPGWAQEPKALVGEILLSGTVESLDVVNSRLTITATSFTGASGANKALPQPKSKLIQLGDATQFLESSGLKNPSLGDLAKGLAVRVVGKELGTGKPFAARQLAWTSVAPVLPPDPLTPPAIAAFLPPPQQAKDISLRIIDAGFAPLNVLMPYPHVEKRPSYFFSYRLTGPEVTGTNTNGSKRTLNDFVVIRRLYGPQGQILERPGAGILDRKDFMAPGHQVYVGDVDPSWPSITAEFEILNNQAPNSAPGIVTSTLTFDKLPVPGAIGKTMPIKRTLTTALGTRINLDDVAGIRVVNRDATNFTFHWTPPAGIPDLKLNLDISSIQSGEEKWQSNSGGGGTDWDRITTRIDTLGPTGAQEMSLTLRVKEQAPSLQERKWFSLVRVNIPVASLLETTFPAATRPPISPKLPETTTPNLQIQAESKYSGVRNSWGGILWVKAQDMTPNENWFVREATSTNEKGTKMNTQIYPLGNPTLYWKVDGSPAQGKEYSQSMLAVSDAEPTETNLQLKLEKARRLVQWSRLQDLPVPAAGQTIDVPVGQIEDEIITVRRIMSYRDLTDLPGFADARGKIPVKAGLAVVIEVSTLLPDSILEVSTRTATDNEGRDLGDSGYSTSDGDKTRSKQENTRLRTIILPLPNPEIKSFEIRLKTTQTVWSGQTQLVELKGIPNSKPPF